MSNLTWGILATGEADDVEHFLATTDLASSLFSPESEFIKPALFNCLLNFDTNPAILSKALQMLQETHLLLPPGIRDEEISPKLENLLQIMTSQILSIDVSLSFLELLALLCEQNILRTRGSSSLPRHIFYYTNKVLEFHVSAKNIQRVGLRLVELVLEQQSQYIISLQENNNTAQLEKSISQLSSAASIILGSVLESLQMYEDDEVIALCCLSILSTCGQVVSDILTPRVEFLTSLTMKIIAKYIQRCESQGEGESAGRLQLPYLLIDQCLGFMYYLSFWENSMLIFARQTKGLFFFSDILLLVVYKYSESEVPVSSDSSVDSTIPHSVVEVQTRSVLYTLDILLKILEDYTYATALFELVVDIHPIDYALEFQKKLIYIYEICNRVFNTKKNSDGFARLKDTYKQINGLLEEMMKPEEGEQQEEEEQEDEEEEPEVHRVEDVDDLYEEPAAESTPVPEEEEIFVSKTPFSSASATPASQPGSSVSTYSSPPGSPDASLSVTSSSPVASPSPSKSPVSPLQVMVDPASLSNEESRELEKIIKKLKKEKESLTKSISKEKDRLKSLEQERIFQEKQLEETVSQLDRKEQEKFDILQQKSELLRLQQQQYESMRKDESERLARERKELERQQEDIHKLLDEQKEESRRVKEIREEWEKKKREEEISLETRLKEAKRQEEKILAEKAENEKLLRQVAEESERLEILRQQDEDSDYEDNETGRVGARKQFKKNLELLQLEKNHLLDFEKELKEQFQALELQKEEYEAYLHDQEVQLRDRSSELDKTTAELNEKCLELNRKEQQLSLQQRQLQQLEDEKMKLLKEAQYKIENNFITQKELLDREEDDKKKKFKEFQAEVEKKLRLQKEEMILKFKEKEEKLVKQQELLLNEHKKMIKELELKQTILHQEETARLAQLESEFQQILQEKEEMMRLKILHHEETLRLQITGLQEVEKELRAQLEEKNLSLQAKEDEIYSLQDRLSEMEGQMNFAGTFSLYGENTPINPFQVPNSLPLPHGGRGLLAITTPDPKTHFDYSTPSNTLYATSPELKRAQSSEIDEQGRKTKARGSTKKLSKSPSPSPFMFQPIFKVDMSCQTNEDWLESALPDDKTLADKNLVDELLSQLKSAQNSTAQSVSRATSMHQLFLSSAQKIEMLVTENDKLMRRIRSGGDLGDILDSDDLSVDNSMDDGSFLGETYSSSFIRDENYPSKGSRLLTPAQSASSRRNEYSRSLSEKKKSGTNSKSAGFNFSVSQRIQVANPVAESGKNSLVLAGIVEGLSFADTTGVPIEVSVGANSTPGGTGSPVQTPGLSADYAEEGEEALNMKSYVSLKRDFEGDSSSLVIGEIDEGNAQELDDLADVIRRLFNHLYHSHNAPQPSSSAPTTPLITTASSPLIPAPHAAPPTSFRQQPVVHIRFLRSALVAMDIIDGSRLTSQRAELIFASLRTKFFTLFGTAFALTIVAKKYFATENLKQFFINFREKILNFLNEVEDTSPFRKPLKITSSSLMTPQSSTVVKTQPGDEMEAEPLITKGEFEELLRLMEKEKKCFFTIFEAYSTRYSKQSIGRNVESEENELELSARIKYMKKLQEEDDKSQQRLRRICQIYPEKFLFATSSQVVSSSSLQSENLNNFMTSHVSTQSSALLHGMSFQNVLQFAKEFKISPDLLNRQQLIEVFKSASITSILSSAATEYDDNIYLSFAEFLDFLYLVATRCALFKGNNTPLVKFTNLLLMLNLSGGSEIISRRHRGIEAIVFRPQVRVILDNSENRGEKGNILTPARRGSKILPVTDKSSLFVDPKTGSIIQGRKRSSITDLRQFIGRK